jgi:hypothetical protein
MHVKPIITIASAAALVLASGTPALANKGSGNGRDVKRATGACATGVWKLKAKPDNGRLEVEFELDTNRVGQKWRVRLADNGHRFFFGSRTTHGPSGEFSVERKIANRAGADHLRATATRVSNGRTCSGSLTF